MGHLYNTAIRAVKAYEENPNTSRFDMLARWFETLKENPGRMQLRDIHAQTVNTIGAGSDTVSTAMQSFVYHMIRHPKAWSRVRDGIDAARARGLCEDRIVSFADAQQLPFLQACLKEALRMFGLISMGLPRVAPKQGLKIGNRLIPAGTIVSVNPWVIHFSAEFWGPDVYAFNPDRWLAKPRAPGSILPE